MKYRMFSLFLVLFYAQVFPMDLDQTDLKTLLDLSTANAKESKSFDLSEDARKILPELVDQSGEPKLEKSIAQLFTHLKSEQQSQLSSHLQPLLQSEALKQINIGALLEELTKAQANKRVTQRNKTVENEHVRWFNPARWFVPESFGCGVLISTYALAFYGSATFPGYTYYNLEPSSTCEDGWYATLCKAHIKAHPGHYIIN